MSFRNVVLVAVLGSATAAAPGPEFPRRQAQQMEPACMEALADEPGKSTAQVARCVLSCLSEVDAQIAAMEGGLNDADVDQSDDIPVEWTVESLIQRENEYGVTDPGPCSRCMLAMQSCMGVTIADQRAAAVRDGVNTEGKGWLTFDITAEDFQCLARIDWGVEGAGNPKLYQFKMERLCYPAVCSYQDVTDLFKYEIRDALSQSQRTNWESTTACDVFATFIDESAPWWILAIGFFYVIGNIALSSTGNPSFLRCMLWCYMAFDIGVGFGLIIYGFLVLSYGNMPTAIKVIFPLFGAVQVTIGGLLSIVMDKGDSRTGINTGVCACLAGKTWLLWFSNALALGYGITCLILALIYQITGKTSVEKFMTDFNEQDHEMSLSEKNEMFDFMVQSQTLMITLLIISSLLQFCTIALSTGCPCWENSGGLKRAQQAENMFQLQEDDNQSVARSAKKDREAAKWVEEKRREAGARP